ncbi:hypothetical protein, partial [Streptomyces sp. NPDC022067]|uniref:hypothetical protein n=1 Tax=Streptomyces sp. NPDC022067 TaxID=3154906 RepID=UPI00340A0769
GVQRVQVPPVDHGGGPGGEPSRAGGGLAHDRPAARRELTLWWRERSGPAPLAAHPAARLARRVRLALSGR